MNDNLKSTLQTVWEVLNAAVYDLTEGDPADALGAVEESRDLIEQWIDTDK